jgi:hypothetical protein
MSNRAIRQYTETIEKEGFTILEVLHGGKHPRARVQYRGQSRIIALAYSPSDNRAMLNFRTDIRKIKRNIEMEQTA